MKRFRPLLAIAAAAVAVTVGVTGCDSSPVAASVNGTFIKQTALQQRMRQLGADGALVSALRQEGVATAGDAPGAYSATFAAFNLSTLVQQQIVDQRFKSQHHRVTAAEVAAARSVLEATYPGWAGLPASVRTNQATFDAELASYFAPTDLPDIQQAYASHRAYFFSQVCTRQITVTVAGDNGGVDFPASLARANQIEEQDYSGTPSTAPAADGGAPPTTTPSSPTTPSTAPTSAPDTSTSSTAPATTAPAGTPPTVPGATTVPGAPTTTTTSTSDTSTSDTSTSDTSTTTAPPTPTGGAVACYSPTALEGQGTAEFNQVLGLAPGHALLPRRTSYGYTILAVDSRRFQPFGPAVAAAIQFNAIEGEQQGPDVTRLLELEGDATVRVNPAFGSWNRSAAQVLPSSLPVTIEKKMSGEPLAP